SRAVISVDPPGGNGTTMRTAREGKSGATDCVAGVGDCAGDHDAWPARPHASTASASLRPRVNSNCFDPSICIALLLLKETPGRSQGFLRPRGGKPSE